MFPFHCWWWRNHLDVSGRVRRVYSGCRDAAQRGQFLCRCLEFLDDLTDHTALLQIDLQKVPDDWMDGMAKEPERVLRGIRIARQGEDQAT